MIEEKWLMNSNKVDTYNIGEEWVNKSGKYSDDIYGWPMDVVNRDWGSYINYVTIFYGGQ